ncbi:hypothetical protein HWV62_43160 [Athelia sp. TMB]|nr:hypothetical protein HWV62_43160 [Athelia sp. TMB]
MAPDIRRSSRKVSTNDEIELMRARGELSCAECKRLKLRNYLAVPVSVEDAQPYVHTAVSTVSKGPVLICPRYDLTDADEVHRAISEMSERIRQLENALALLQSSISSAKHPLLQDELLFIKHGPGKHLPSDFDVPGDPYVEAVDAFGTLTPHLYGLFVNVPPPDIALKAESEPEKNDTSRQAMPELLNSIAAMFPMGSRYPTGPETYEQAMSLLFAWLPPRARACDLCEKFLARVTWLFRPVKRDELMGDILDPVYAAKQEHDDPHCATAIKVSPHKVSTLYSIFALGSLVDPTQPIWNSEEAERYHHCARAALALRSIFDSPMVETVLAILVLSYYCSNVAHRYTQDSIWMLTSLCSKVAQSSLALGRPPSIGLPYVDCALPRLQSDSDIEDQFWNWKYQFNKNIFGSVLEMTVGVKSPDYQTILEFDRKVREMPLPSALSHFLSMDRDEMDMNIFMKSGYLSMVRSVTMSMIHKSHFARALTDHPADPLSSPYTTSVLAVARCSSAIIQNSSLYTKRFPEVCARWWVLWHHLFAAAMIAGLIVTRAPSSTLAPTAFTELDIAVKIFEHGAKLSKRIQTGLEVLRRLQKKATRLFNRQHDCDEIPASTSQGEDHDTDELALFSGQTRGPIGKQKAPAAAPQADVWPTPPDPTSSKGTAIPSTSYHDIRLPSVNHLSFSQPQSSHQNSEVPMPNFSSFEMPTGFPIGQDPSQPSSSDPVYNSTSVDPLRQLYADTFSTSEVDSALVEDWATFVRQNGFV